MINIDVINDKKPFLFGCEVHIVRFQVSWQHGGEPISLLFLWRRAATSLCKNVGSEQLVGRQPPLRHMLPTIYESDNRNGC